MAKVFIYSNQPVIEVNGRYYTKLKNFVDFLSLLSLKSDRYTLIVPCKSGSHLDASSLSEVELPDKLIKLPFYEGHIQALLHSARNSWQVASTIKKELNLGGSVILAGPGPNSFLYLLSLFLPNNVRYAFFIRGDTFKTVKHIYSDHIGRAFVLALVRLFQNRIFSLLMRKRAIAFTYGSDLMEAYGAFGKVFNIAPLISEQLIIDPVINKKMLTGSTFKVLFVGRLSSEKGIIDLIDSFAIVKKMNRPFHLTVVGFGPLKRK